MKNLILILLLALGFSAQAQQHTVTAADVTLDGSKIASYIGTATDIVIPATIDGTAITTINASVFRSKGITSVVISEGITTIGDYAFRSCPLTGGVTLPSTLTSIGQRSFESTELTSVEIPDGVTSLPYLTFRNCTSLTTVKLPKYITSIDRAFSGCTALEATTLPTTTPEGMVNDTDWQLYDKVGGALDESAGVQTEINQTNNAKAFVRTIIEGSMLPVELTAEMVTIADGEITAYSGNAASLILPVEIDGVQITGIAADVFASKGVVEFEIAENSNLNTIGAGAFADNDASLKITLPTGAPEGIAYEAWKTGESVETATISSSNWSSSFARELPAITSYNVVYHDGDETVSLEPAVFIPNSDLVLPEYTTDKVGYEASTWCVDVTLFNPVTSFEEALEYADGSTIHLYAKWAVEEFTITYNLFGGKNDESNPMSYTALSDAFSIKAPTKSGDTFVKWSLDPNGETTATTDITKGTTGNLTLYAIWQGMTYDYYTLTADDVTIDESGNITAYSGTGHDRIFIPSDFGNGVIASTVWHVSKKGAFESNKEITYVVFAEGINRIGEDAFQSASNLQSVIFPSSMTRTDYRSFRSCGLTEVLFSGNSNFNYIYKLSFDKNSNLDQALPTDAPIGYTAGEWTKSDGTVITNISSSNIGEIERMLEPSAYELTAENLTTDGKGTITGYTGEYTKIEIPMVLNGELLTGIAEGVFQGKGLVKVVFAKQSGMSQIAANAFADNDASLVVNLPADFPTNMYFEEWKDAEGILATQIKSDGVSKAYSRLQVAIENFTVKYFDGETELSLTPSSYKTGEEVVLPGTPDDKVESGYNLEGWYADAALTTKVESIYAASKNDVDNVITLYAKWIPIEYTITYYLNGGVAAENAPTSYTVETPTFTIPEPTFEGYEFWKWTSDDTGFLTFPSTVATGTTGNLDLYAQWKEASVEYITLGAADLTLNGGTITAYLGEAANVIIPAYVESGESKVAIKAIAADAFKAKSLAAVVFESPSELESVDASAFAENEGLEVVLPTGSVYGTRVESWKNADGVFTPKVVSGEEGVISREVMTFNFKPRQVEKLNRGLIAMQSASGIFLSWRILGTDPNNIAFNIYKNGELLNAEPHDGNSNFIDPSGTVDDVYKVEALSGDDKGFSKEIKPWKYTDQKDSESRPDISVLRIKMPEAPVDPLGGTRSYTPGDMSVGDLDGDGEYELVFIWEAAEAIEVSGVKNDRRCPVVDAVKLDGTHMWRINGGINTDANGLALMVYDLDGDGKAEVALKTGPGTMDGTGEHLSKGPAATDNNDVVLNRGGRGHLIKDPSYVTVFEGATGKEKATVNYWPSIGPTEDINATWGDDDGYRAASIKSAVLVDQERGPQLVFSRGIYTRIAMQALTFDGDTLVQAWTFDQLDHADEKPDTGEGQAYFGEGNHSLSIGDVDFDGSDELMYGACAFDNDGKGLYSTGRKHGDADHLGDLMPDRPGLEFFQPHENATYGVSMRDAATGEIIWEYLSSGDIGRAWAANVTDRTRGFECTSVLTGSPFAGIGNLDCNGDITGFGYNPYNQPVYFDGDLFSDVRHNGNAVNSTSGGGRIFTGWYYGASTIHSTKDDVNLQADLFGDWREELVFKSSDNSEFIVFSTWIPTTHKMYTLMHDPLYRMNILRQNIGYNQPAHLGFYLEDGVQTPFISYDKQWEDYVEPEPEPDPTYEITYHLGIDGASHANPTEVIVGTPVVLRNAEAKGYRFMDWYADADFSKKVSSFTTSQTEDVEVWARWKKLGEFHIYPTVTADYITVSSTVSSDIIDVSNSTGVVVKQIQMNAKQATVNLSDLTPGMYILRSRNTEVTTKVVVR
ncbi:MAG: leucine-rich repeat protein [Mangrovibacterium sp.]